MGGCSNRGQIYISANSNLTNIIKKFDCHAGTILWCTENKRKHLNLNHHDFLNYCEDYFNNQHSDKPKIFDLIKSEIIS